MPFPARAKGVADENRGHNLGHPSKSNQEFYF